MHHARFQHIAINGIASALPEKGLTLKDFTESFGALEVERIARSTGIEAVRIADGLSTVDLAVGAANSLIDGLKIQKASIDAVVLVTQTPDHCMPASSALLAHRLGLHHDIPAFDLNFGCSGYLYGLFQAAMLISSGGCGCVLVCTSDVISKLLHPDDRHVRMVFGDGATATLVSQGLDGLDLSFQTDGGGENHLRTPITYGADPACSAATGFLQMDGAQVMNFALDRVPVAINQFLAQCQMPSADQLPLLLLHQANQFMLGYLSKKLRIPPERVPVSIRHVGNTGPSSIPLMISQGHPAHSFQQNDVIACGFGVGLSIGVGRLALASTLVIPPINVAGHSAVH